MGKVTSGAMFDPAATATGGSEIKNVWADKFTISVESATTAGSGTSVTEIQVSNRNLKPTLDAEWDTIGTISHLVLSTTKVVDSLAVAAPYRWVRTRVITIGGTGAWVQAYMASDNT